MTVGSAASLSRPARGVPLSLFRSTPESGLPPMARGAPPGRTPLALAASDPPRGKILLVADQAVIALDLHRLVRDAGWSIVGPASSVPQAGRLLARGGIECALIDLDLEPRTASDVAALLARADIPVVFLTGANAQPDGEAVRPVVPKPITASALLAAVEQAVSGDEDSGEIHYPTSPPVISWPRVMPQL